MTPYYEYKGITIYHGNCLEILPELNRPVDLLLSDPQYGINVVKVKKGEHFGTIGGIRKGRMRAKTKKYLPVYGDDKPFDPTPFLDYPEVMLFGANYFSSKLPDSRCWLVWDKDNGGSDFADCELIWTNLKGSVRKFKYRWNGYLKEHPEYRWHPTQKPLALIKWCMGKSKTTGTVLDPFMGSGTTLVAAKEFGRKAIGIEIEEKYCEVTARRLSQEILPFGSRLGH